MLFKALFMLASLVLVHSDMEDDLAVLRKEVAQVSALRERIIEVEARLREAELKKPSVTVRELAAANMDDLVTALDHLWLLIAGSLVMFMQAGFAMLEAGACRAKNVQNILNKNISDVCIGTLSWWIFGWAFAFGTVAEADGGNDFIGNHGFFAKDFSRASDSGNQDGGLARGFEPGTTNQLNWFFQWAFCSAAATIVSGAVAERVNFLPYALYTTVMCTFIYPVVVASTWGGGFLSSMNDVGFMDFAGSGIVHLTGGVGALIGAIMVGPRNGRFEYPEEFHPHNLPLVVLGTFILWFGWYGFNVGSTLTMHDAAVASLGAHVAMTTTISAATGGLTVFGLRWATSKKYDVVGMCNGILAGLVSITAPCGNVEVGSAFAIGLIGGVLYTGAAHLMLKLKIDDPLDAFPVHGVCGLWGVLAAAIFDWGKGFDHVNGWNGWTCVTAAEDDTSCMAGAWLQLFAANICEILFIVTWVGVISLVVLGPMRLLGVLRVSDQVQDGGTDMAQQVYPKGYSFGCGTENDVKRFVC